MGFAMEPAEESLLDKSPLKKGMLSGMYGDAKSLGNLSKTSKQ